MKQSHMGQKPAAAPKEPEWDKVFSDELDQFAAADAWREITQEMRLACTLSRANAHDIRRLVDFRVAYDRAARQVAELGPVLKAKRAKVGQWNPHFSVMQKASVEIRAIEADLGLTPTTRGRAVKAPLTGKKRWTASDEYIEPTGKYYRAPKGG